jgi:nitric oxide reductase NorE protein
MNQLENDSIRPNVFYPPGGILIWILVIVEVITFFMGIGSLLIEKKSNLEEFLKMQSSLNVNIAVWNTFFLITSGYAMALSVGYLKKNEAVKFTLTLVISIFFGLVFLGFKGWEYNLKLDSGLDLHSGTFWTYYWFLTGFHYFHVIAGMIILTLVFLYRKTISLENLEASATFWHMCDLIWVVLFPTLYLLH